MLTSKQKELLLFINERIQETGVSPSFDEMKDALNLASKSGIHRLITALEERGFIRRLAHRARALEVLKLPESVTPGAPRGRKEFKPALVSSGKPASAPTSHTVPLIGINNRDLKRMVTDLATTERLAPLVPDGKVLISESGVSSPENIERLRKTGARRFLIGESLMKMGINRHKSVTQMRVAGTN